MNAIRLRLRQAQGGSVITLMTRAFVAFATVVALMPATQAEAGSYSSVSVASNTALGKSADGASRLPALSGNGDFVLFQSQAANLGAGGQDVFIRDLASGLTDIVSTAPDGARADGPSGSASASADGRFVVFVSSATNLVAGDANNAHDVFYRDRDTGDLVAVSVAVSGTTAGGDSHSPVISGDGRYVAFVSSAGDIVAGDTGSYDDVFVRDMVTGVTSLVTLSRLGGSADGHSSAPSISEDGSTIAFASRATDLVTGDSNGQPDVFVVRRGGGSMRRVSVSSVGTQSTLGSFAPSLDRTGRLVAFESLASNLVPGDGNQARDVFVYDTTTGTTRLVSKTPAGVLGDAESREANLSPDGASVAFVTVASNLVGGDTNATSDVLMSSLSTGQLTRVSNARKGGAANGPSSAPAFNGSGGVVAFQSDASDIAVGDSNGATDVFVAEFGTRVYTRIAGRDRYTTAVEISKRAFPYGAPVVVIATGMNWPDALGGSSLAGVVGGPLLLTETGRLTPSVRAEIARLGAKSAYILGGTASVSAKAESELRALVGGVTRLGGRDRYATAGAIADQVVRLQGAQFDGTVLMATGGGYPDALAGSPVAAASGAPIVLVQPGTSAYRLPAATRRTVILGGPMSVSTAVENAVKSRFGAANVTRLGGRDRYAAAAAISQWGVDEVGLAWDGATVATGQKFPDALSGGVMAGRAGSVVMLTRGTELSAEPARLLAANSGLIGEVRVVGGPASVSEAVMSSIKKTMGD